MTLKLGMTAENKSSCTILSISRHIIENLR